MPQAQRSQRETTASILPVFTKLMGCAAEDVVVSVVPGLAYEVEVLL